MKLDTVQKHAGKVYEKKIVNGKEKSIVKRNLLLDGNLWRNVDIANVWKNTKNI